MAAEGGERAVMMTVSPVADGLAYVYGRVLPGADGLVRRWEYLGSSASREEAIERARRLAEGAEVRVEEAAAVGAAEAAGIGSTRPPADS